MTERPAWGRPALTGRAPLVVGGAALLLLVWPFGTGLGAAVLAVLVVAALVADLFLAPRPARVGVARSLPAVVGLGAPATLELDGAQPLPTGRWWCASPTSSPRRLGASARRARVRVPARRSVTLRVALGPHPPGTVHSRASSSSGPRAPGAHGPPGPARACPVSSGSIPVSGPAAKPTSASSGPGSWRWACAAPAPGAVAPSSTSCASTGSTTTAGASTGRRRPGPTARS